MNEEITIYELLRLPVKQYPKKIKWNNCTFHKVGDKFYDEDEEYDLTFYTSIYDFNKTVQIIEEQDEFVDIDLIKLNSDGWITYKENGEYHNFNTNKKDKFYINKINDLIKNQKLIIEKLKNE